VTVDDPTVPNQSVLVQRRAGALIITLNRPAARNAIDNSLGLGLLDVVTDAATDSTVRAVLITGAGPAFCAGADLHTQRELTPDGHQDLGGRARRRLNPVIMALRTMPKPAIAAVNGPAVGAGCSLALACDLVLAAESAFFLLGFARVGLGLDGGSSVSLTSRVGFARATEMALLNERISARDALAWGMVNRVHPDGELLARAEELVVELAGGPTSAFAAAKEALREAVAKDLARQLELEADLQQRQARSKDFAEALAAFRDKRPPVYTGT
jgi:2-(1,2-epoxy-1,2-dihydrophenyl)acetyl-CoA isomerase